MSEHVKIAEFEVDSAIIPASVYHDGRTEMPHRVTTSGLALSYGAFREVAQFIKMFSRDAMPDGNTAQHYFRLDAFFDPRSETLQLLEVNARFVDGWGIALNLSRAAGHTLMQHKDDIDVDFPCIWQLEDERYRGEFELAIKEINLMNRYREHRSNCVENGPDYQRNLTEIYWYGYHAPRALKRVRMVAPRDGELLDNKMTLANFAAKWKGSVLQIPTFHSHEVCAWGQLPEKVIFKFINKLGPEARRAHASVLYRDQIGSGRFAKRCYENGSLIAQDLVEGMEVCAGGESVLQAVILAVDDGPLTGYTLGAPKGTRIVNDSFTHGPLVINLPQKASRYYGGGGHD